MLRKFVLLLSAVIFLISTTVTSVAELKIESVKVGLSKDLIYFVFPDRYLNGDISNDKGDGFKPNQTAFFHGGDLKGLTGTCSEGDNGLTRIKKLGFTAVWVTPLVVQQKATSGGAGYHGYWGVNFLEVDPHLGTKEDLLEFAQCAKKLNLKLILDIVTNHTGDIIQYNEKTAFIPSDLGSAKSPAWLNDLSNYHNVGSIDRCWGDGPCMQIGDFYSLDDVATEKKLVVDGWAQVYGQWIKDLGLSGFRVDTARHLDDNFFINWSPQIIKQAKTVGINDFTIFGEVWDINPVNLVNYVRQNKIQTVLDFPFQRTVTEFAAGFSDASILENLFRYDDMYTSATSDASNLVTFLGNHDMGRAAKMIEAAKINKKSELLPRTLLGHALLYFSRGIPAVYYGDEVGMIGTGSGSDQLARQDMFTTQVDFWKNEERVGSSPIGNSDSFAVTDSHPIAQYLKKLALLRSTHSGLANATMQVRYAKDSILVISKKDNTENREYLVGFNNSTKAKTIKIYTATSEGGWKVLLGSPKSIVRNEFVTLTIPALSTIILKANQKINKTNFKIVKLSSKIDFLSGYYETKLGVETNDILKVQFFSRTSKNQPWIFQGTDTNAPYSIYLDASGYSGKRVELRAQVTNSKGEKRESAVAAISIPSP